MRTYPFKSKFLLALTLLAITAQSCTKPTNADTGNDGAKFAGTWTGTYGTASASTTLTFTPGGNGNALTMLGSVGASTGCAKTVTFNLVASGNTILLPAQIFYDNCGVSYTVTGNGSINGSTLTFTENISGGVSSTYNFTGVK